MAGIKGWITIEIPVAKILADRYSNRKNHKAITPIAGELPYNPFEYERNKTTEVINIGGHHVTRVIADYSMKSEITAASLFGVGYNYSVPLAKSVKFHLSNGTE